MSFGFQIRNAAGTVVLDTTRRGGLFLERVEPPVGGTLTRDYPQATGRTVFVIGWALRLSNGAFVPAAFTISYPGGVPRVAFAAMGYPTEWFVFAQ